MRAVPARCAHADAMHNMLARGAQGRLYTAAMGGAFRLENQSSQWVFIHEGHKWQRFVSNRTQRRTNRTVYKGTHDYQRIALDFGGRVAFPSDQGLFVIPPGNGTKFIVANGNLCTRRTLTRLRPDEGISCQHMKACIIHTRKHASSTHESMHHPHTKACTP